MGPLKLFIRYEVRQRKQHSVARKFGFTTVFTKFRDLQNQFRIRNIEPKYPSGVYYEVYCNDCTKYTKQKLDES